jgi:hypothetical protein
MSYLDFKAGHTWTSKVAVDIDAHDIGAIGTDEQVFTQFPGESDISGLMPVRFGVYNTTANMNQHLSSAEYCKGDKP